VNSNQLFSRVAVRKLFRQRWAAGVIVLLLFLLVATVWQHRQTAGIPKRGEQSTAMGDFSQKMEQAVARLADVEAQARQPGSKLSPEELRATAYGVLRSDLGLPAGTLAKELPAFALELSNRGDTALLMRARAAYALDRFDDAEKLSLESAAQDRQGYESTQRLEEDRRKRAIEGFELAGYSARQRSQYADALKHLREAEKLTDRDLSPQDWAEVQYAIADLLIVQGQCNSAENVLRSVVEVRTQVLGPEHPDTLWSRGNLAIALAAQGKYAEAEAQFRGVFAIREKVTRPEHHTLESRTSLAIALARQGKAAEAEAQFREIITIEEKVLGPEHPDTLASRGNLANALDLQGKAAEAEAQFREIIKVEERVLGPEHPATLDSCYEFAFALKRQNKLQEAKEFVRRAIEGARKVLGRQHPFTQKYEKFLADLETNK
jgi:tetratricopeptide (TPR) repeat protein